MSPTPVCPLTLPTLSNPLLDLATPLKPTCIRYYCIYFSLSNFYSRPLDVCSIMTLRLLLCLSLRALLMLMTLHYIRTIKTGLSNSDFKDHHQTNSCCKVTCEQMYVQLLLKCSQQMRQTFHWREYWILTCFAPVTKCSRMWLGVASVFVY